VAGGVATGTAHILGGAVIGRAYHPGVIDSDGRVFALSATPEAEAVEAATEA
jgi:hypothetical protein